MTTPLDTLAQAEATARTASRRVTLGARTLALIHTTERRP
jgi:hypothetical protein